MITLFLSKIDNLLTITSLNINTSALKHQYKQPTPTGSAYNRCAEIAKNVTSPAQAYSYEVVIYWKCKEKRLKLFFGFVLN